MSTARRVPAFGPHRISFVRISEDTSRTVVFGVMEVEKKSSYPGHTILSRLCPPRSAPPPPPPRRALPPRPAVPRPAPPRSWGVRVLDSTGGLAKHHVGTTNASIVGFHILHFLRQSFSSCLTQSTDIPKTVPFYPVSWNTTYAFFFDRNNSFLSMLKHYSRRMLGCQHVETFCIATHAHRQRFEGIWFVAHRCEVGARFLLLLE